ncbi:MAG: hypothetical protein JKX72_03185 [Robiginitomaculum sp.]|nr:hypothetical protein [Robiginitomaculum sp.]
MKRTIKIFRVANVFIVWNPLKMLPILFWEIIWKTAWHLTVTLAELQSGEIDESTTSVAFACALVLIVYAVLPWDYAFRT